MPKHNKRNVRPRVFSPVTGPAQSTGRTFEGGVGYARDAKGELYLLGVTNLGSEKTFYEQSGARDSRFANLVRQVAVEDPAWMTGFLPWLRNEAFMRTAPAVGVVEAVRAMVKAGVPGGRVLTSRVPGRGDEPGEIMAYHYTTYGKSLPKPLKRGLADACDRLYTQRALLRYDTDSHAIRFADVIEQCRPCGFPPGEPNHDQLIEGSDTAIGPAYADLAQRQGALYRYAIERRHNRGNPVHPSLTMIRAHNELVAAAQADWRVLLDTGWLRRAGMRWETGLSLAGSRADKAALWAAYIPVMGVQALLMNLRNFDEAGVSDQAAQIAADKISNPVDVAASKMFPLRFLAAYRAAPNLRWGVPLEKGLALSLGNVPQLRGRTLVLIDTSRSMNDPFSEDGKLRRWDAAAIFGIALAQRCERADVVSFSGRSYGYENREAVTKEFPLARGESLLRSLERFRTGGYFLNAGTDTDLALAKHYAGHDRVVIVTDEQSDSGPRSNWVAPPISEVAKHRPSHVPLFTFNLAGYQYGHAPAGLENCHVIGGLSDASFRMVGLIDAGRSADWPWTEVKMPDYAPAGHARTARPG